MDAVYGYIEHPRTRSRMTLRITRSEHGMGWYAMECTSGNGDRHFTKLEEYLERNRQTETFWQYKIIFIPAAREHRV